MNRFQKLNQHVPLAKKMSSLLWILPVVLTCCAEAGRTGDADGGVTDAAEDIVEEERDARQFDMPQDAEPESEPVCVTQNLLKNADFDLGEAYWFLSWSSPGLPYLIVNSVLAHSPDQLLALGGASTGRTETDAAEQDIDVPSGATNMRLSGQMLILTDENPDSQTIYDFAHLEIEELASGVEVIHRVSNVDALPQAQWVPFSSAVTGDYAGKVIRFRVHSQTNLSKDTVFGFDSLALNVTLCETP